MISRRVALKNLAGLSMMAIANKTFASSPDKQALPAEHFGVKADGLTNDRIALQQAIDHSAGNPLRLSGEIRIDSAGLTLRPNSHIVFAEGASIKLLPHTQNNYQIFRIWDVTNVKIDNGTIDGSRELCSAIDDPKANGYGMGISITGSSHVQLNNVLTKGCWGDGIYIANSFSDKGKISSDVVVRNHHADACRRQGVSIISGKSIIFENPVWENIGGTLPSAGLDIEPNSNFDVLENIVIKNPITRNCLSGIEMWLDRMLGPVPKNINIHIINHRDEDSEYAYKVMGLKRCNFQVIGEIVSESPMWIHSRKKPQIVSGIDCPSVSVVTKNAIIR